MNITVLGLGHLGLVAAAGLACQGHVVTGLDIDNLRIEKLRNGLRPIYEPGLYEWLNEGVSGGRLKFLRLEEFRGDVGEVVLVATGTPAAAWGEADLLQVQTALRWVKGLRPTNTTVVMKSTVPPGSGRTFCQGELEGLDIEYVANPEFLREGGAVHDWMFPDRIVVGTVDASLRSANVVKRMYSGIEAPYLVTDITSAEMLKYASNAFLATRISFINEIASLCEKVGASIDAISEGLAMDVRMGPEIHAGIGYGGSCFPKDIRALEHLAAANGVQLDLLKSVTAINDRQRQLPLTRLRDRFGGNLAGLKVGVLGLAFKPATNDVREAASLKLINALVDEGAKVRAFDPQAAQPARALLPDCVEFAHGPTEAARDAHSLLLLTEWPEIVGADWAAVAAEMRAPKFVIDGRNALDPENMVCLGFEYSGVGRGQVNLLANERDTVPTQPAPLLPMT